MRVLVNTLTVEGPRTGIGHYTSELVRALRQLQGDEAVGTFPGGLLRRARAAWAGAQKGGQLSGPPGIAGRARQAVRGKFVELARRCGRALIRTSFRLTAGR